MNQRSKMILGAAVLAALTTVRPAHALTWGTFGTWDTQARRDAADAAMLADTNRFNIYGDFNYGNDGNIDVDYNAGVPTAQSNYYGTIDFGGTYPNQRVAQHEMNHWLGSGTYSNWYNLFTNGVWTGAKMNQLIQQFDGDGSVIRQSGVHFYGYGLNYDTEVVNDSILMRNVALMYAMRQDMGNGNQANPWSATTVTLAASDTVGTSAFNWFGGGWSNSSYQGWNDKYFAHAGAAYFTSDYTIRTPLDTYNPSGATPSFTFGGDSLTINNTNGINGGLLFKGVGTTGILTIKNLTLSGGYVRHASGSGDLFQLAGNTILAAGTTSTIDSAQGNIRILAPISGSGSFNSIGNYTTTLTGANTYSGATNINAGTLAFTTSLSNVGSVNVANGATLRVQARGFNSTTLASTSLTLGSSAASTLAFDFNSLDAGAPLISTGALTANGAVNVSLLNAGFLTTGTHRLIGYTSFGGAGSFPASTFALGTRSTGVLANNGTNALNLIVTADRPIWTGKDGGNWIVGATGANKNWKLQTATTATDYIQGDNVLFDDSATSTAVNINGANVSPLATTFNNSNKDYTVTGGSYGIAGTGALIKNGTGTVTLASPNTYNGGTTINNGVLSISADNNLGASASPVTLSGGTLRTTAGIVNTHAVTVGSGGGTISVTTTGQYYFNAANSLLGSGPLTLTGAGTLTANVGNLRIDQPNSYSGVATMTGGGIFEYGTAGAVSAAATFNIANQGELSAQTGLSLPNAITVTGGTNSVLSFENGNAGIVTGPIALNANLTVGLRDWYNNATVRGGTINGTVSGAGSLAVNSGTGTGGTLTLGGLNTFTGNVTIDNSVLAAGTQINNFGAPAAQIASNLGDLAAANRTITVNNGGTLSLTGGNVLGIGSSQNTLSGLTLAINPGGVFQSGLNGSGAGWWNKVGKVTLNGGSIHVGSGANNSSFQALALVGNVTVGGSAASTIDTFAASDATSNGIHLGQNAGTGQVITFNVADATANANADLTVAARLLNTAGNLVASGLTKTGVGTMLISGANTYSGATTVNAGTLKATAPAYSNFLNNAGGLDLQSTGKVLLDYTGGSSPVATVKSILDSGYAGGFASGKIRSTIHGSGQTIGYGDNGTDTVTLRLTLPGDADLNGSVDFNDFLALQANFGQTGTRFDQGNFNYDGATDFNDFLALQANFGQSASGAPVAITAQQVAAMTAFAQAVPEPASIALLGLSATGLIRRRRA